MMVEIAMRNIIVALTFVAISLCAARAEDDVADTYKFVSATRMIVETGGDRASGAR
jgi:hypothetical protein